MAGQMWEIEHNTLIGRAIVENNFQEFLQLLRTEDLTFTDKKGNTYLHFLSSCRRPNFTYRLVAAGADINAQNKHGDTALHTAALCGEPCHLPELMACGIDPFIQDQDGKTAKEVSNNNMYWHEWYKKYSPGVIRCVETNDCKRLQQLIQCWCKVAVSKNGVSARKLAADQGKWDICSILDEARFTQAVIYGVLEGDLKSIKYGLERSPCDVNLLNKASLKPHILQYAIELGDLEATRLLCRAGAHVNTPVHINCYLKGPLYFEVIKPKKELNKKLAFEVLRAGIDITLRDERGRTALIYTLDRSDGDVDLDLVIHFLQCGVDIAARDVTGASARDIARFAHQNDVVEEIDKVMIGYIRSSNMAVLERLACDAYKGFFFEFNHRDTWLYAAGNETDDVLRFIEWLPSYNVKRFHRLICRGDLGAMSHLLESCDRPDMLLRAKDHGGRSPLMLAILFNHADVVKFLLSQDASDIHSKDNMLRTCMHYACSLGEKGGEVRRHLLDMGCRLDDRDVLWRTPQDLLDGTTDCQAGSLVADERSRIYTLKMEVLCLDKYEQLREIICSADGGLAEFMNALKGFKYPVAAFPVILCNEACPLLRDYCDLVFIALLKNKEDIVRRLVMLGADCQRKDMWPPSIEDQTNYSRLLKDQDYQSISSCSTSESDRYLMNILEVVTSLGKTELVEFIKRNKRTIDFDISKGCQI